MKQRLDLGLSYSNNISGLNNLVGPIFELSIGWHFSRGIICGIGGENGYENDFIKNSEVVCPDTGNEKLYENIWYKSKR
jgi:hypothetical protein